MKISKLVLRGENHGRTREREWKTDTLPTQFECMLHFYYHLIPSRKRARIGTYDAWQKSPQRAKGTPSKHASTSVLMSRECLIIEPDIHD